MYLKHTVLVVLSLQTKKADMSKMYLPYSLCDFHAVKFPYWMNLDEIAKQEKYKE